MDASDRTPGPGAAAAHSAESAVHVPVLLDRVLALLAPALSDRAAVVVDATLGLGGHAEALLDAHPQLTLVGLDRDPAALARSGERLARFSARTHLVHAVYDRMPEVLDELGIDGVDGVLFDLGVSSMQLDVAERGFAYAQDAPLDMRMDPRPGTTAGDIVNGYSVAELARILREYGEERFALRVAQAIDRARRERAARRRPPSWPSWSARRSRRRPAGTAAIRPSARSRRCASR